MRRAEVYGAHAHEAGGQWGQVVAARGRGTQAIAASPAQDSRGVGVLVEELLQMQRSRSGRDELQQTDLSVPCSRGLGTALAEEPRVSVNEHVVAPDESVPFYYYYSGSRRGEERVAVDFAAELNHRPINRRCALREPGVRQQPAAGEAKANGPGKCCQNQRQTLPLF